MVTVQAFSAYHPVPEKISQVASPPYDVVNEAEARAFVADHPHSFMKVLRPEVNLASGSSAQEQHDEAKKQLRALINGGLLTKAERALYLYRITRGQHSQTGVFAKCAVDDYEHDRIKKHEHTRPAKVEDRTQHFLTVGAQTGPVFLTYRSTESLSALFDENLKQAPLFDFEDEEGVRHEVFKVSNPEAFEAAFKDVDALYIADGHHRSASACNVRNARKKAGVVADDDPSHGFLAVIFPHDQLRILAYNRLVTELSGSVEDFVKAIAARVPVTEDATVPPAGKGHVAFFAGDKWRSMDLSGLPVEHDDRPEESMDAYKLQQHVFGPIMGVTDPKTDKRLIFWGGHRDKARLEGAVKDGTAKVAFSMYPVSMDEIMDVSDAGRVLPPKSTWFDPKLRSGLFVYEL